MGLFFYCLTVKDKGLDFLSSVLHNDENGEEQEEESANDGETTYGKRKHFNREKDAVRLAANDDRQIAILRSVMSPHSNPSSNTEELNKSTIAKNQMAIITAEKQAIYITSLTAIEQVKSDILEINNIKSMLSDPLVATFCSPEDMAELRFKLRVLMKLSPRTGSDV